MSLGRGLFLCNIWTAAVAAAAAPYIPTHIFTSQASNGSFAYVLQPKNDQTGVELLSLNLSTLDPTSPQYTILYDDVPFSAENEAFVPTLDSNGSITVFTGDCQASQNASLLWAFQPDKNSLIGNGTWSSSSVNAQNTSGTTTNTTGPGYLARGFTFGSLNDTWPVFYTFGGMCPFDNSTEADWMSAAEYSDEMTVLTQMNSSSEPSGFTKQETESSNSPIAEAGYTITPLQMTSSTTSGGETVQEESFLFIGGNTKSAFLNMSTLALFSLPQASWTYISVSSGVESGRTDLAVRASSEIEPRSGHSAVISSDGSKIVIFGGWVGDTSTPAEPQLVVLEVGEGYGGSGEWSWSTPDPTGSGPPTGSGIFGHASAMLSGDVMMISGGYNISTATTATSKRASSTEVAASSQIYLYNLTSNAWVSSYSSLSSSTTSTGSHTTSALSSAGEKAGLGVGVSAGAIAFVCVAYYFWSRNRWRHRRRRDQELRKLALGAERSNIWSEPGLESSYRGDAALRNSILENLYNPGPNHQYSAVPLPDSGTRAEAERSGLLYEVPSPSRGLRRSLSNRPQRIQSASWYEENRINSIHPIDEREEFETPPEGSSEKEPENESSNSARFSDPFVDPPSPTRVALAALHGKTLRQHEGTDDASVLSGKSRATSPEKSERTHSDLSESSRSGISELSIQRSDFGSQRRSTHLFQRAIPTLEPSSSSNHDNNNNTSSGRSSPEKASLQAIRAEISSMRWPFERSDSFSTSGSRHIRALLEGDTLLGSGPEWSTPPESPSRLSDRESKHSNNGSNSLTWMGSIRKTLSTARRAVLGNNSEEEEHNPAVDARMLDITSPVDFDDDEEEPLSLSRRASSASVAHLRRKQGPKDWAVEGSRNSFGAPSASTPSHRRRRRENNNDDDNNNNSNNDIDDAFNDDMDVIDLEHHNAEYGHGGDDNDNHEHEEDDEDWDVEAAAESRLVQITYTVPKERLRVVNAGVGDRVIGDHDDDDVGSAAVMDSKRPQEGI